LCSRQPKPVNTNQAGAPEARAMVGGMYGLSDWRELGGREWACCAEARNVRAGGADPPRNRIGIAVGIGIDQELAGQV
jgi:hypothetical protein